LSDPSRSGRFVKSTRYGNRLVLDAGPLLTYVAMGFAKKYELGNHFVESVWGLGVLDGLQQELAHRFITQYSELHVPGYVLVEALRLRDTVLKSYKAIFQVFAQDFIAENLIESPVVLKELHADPELHRIARLCGIADASVLYVAARNSADVLTDDQRFYANVQTDPSFRVFLFRGVIEGRYDLV
jgi:hypothetical protein